MHALRASPAPAAPAAAPDGARSGRCWRCRPCRRCARGDLHERHGLARPGGQRACAASPAVRGATCGCGRRQRHRERRVAERDRRRHLLLRQRERRTAGAPATPRDGRPRRWCPATTTCRRAANSRLNISSARRSACVTVRRSTTSRVGKRPGMRPVGGLGAEQLDVRGEEIREPASRSSRRAALEHRLAGALRLRGGIDADDGELRGHLEARLRGRR